MPVFATPEPISVELDLTVARVLITASATAETTVDIAPDSQNQASIRDAQDTTADFSGGILTITTPRRRGRMFVEGPKSGGIIVRIDLPAGSRLGGKGAAVNIESSGQLGEVALRTAAGRLHLEHVAALTIDTAAGDIVVDRVAGKVEVNGAHGSVWFGVIDGPAKIKSASGLVEVGEARDVLEINGVNGNVSIGQAHTDARARTVNGAVHVGEVRSGSVVLETAAGSIDVGIRKGTAAWLDAKATLGSVRNGLNGMDEPGAAQDKVQLRARTQFGSIDVHRA